MTSITTRNRYRTPFLPLLLSSLILNSFVNISNGRETSNHGTLENQPLYRMSGESSTVWVNFENPTGSRGAGGKENRGAKGHPAEPLVPGETKTLLDYAGPGIIRHFWLTVDHREPVDLRALRLDMIWDGADTPAVSVPMGDFFGIGLGRITAFENALFSSPEGRSFNATVPMPFRKSARITITNESNHTYNLYYQIDLTALNEEPTDYLYFHAYWSHNTETKLGEDFEILPKIVGSGRYIGANLSIITDPIYGDSWWGEGEVKIYLDGDEKFPTLVGTGTEDYIGTGWGQGTFAHAYQGSLIADQEQGQWTFYRYHIPDPVYFTEDIRVSIQQMGGATPDQLKKIIENGAQFHPVAVASSDGYHKLLEEENPPNPNGSDFPSGWTNFYRLDNYTATAYFYLDSPVHDLPSLAPLVTRLKGIPHQNNR